MDHIGQIVLENVSQSRDIFSLEKVKGDALEVKMIGKQIGIKRA